MARSRPVPLLRPLSGRPPSMRCGARARALQRAGRAV